MIKRFAVGLAALVAALGLGAAAPAYAAPVPAVPIAAPAPAAEPVKMIPNRQGALVGGGQVSAFGPPWYYQYQRAAFNNAAVPGVRFDMNVESPWKSAAEDHTLSQVAICKDGSAQDCVEFGWIKSDYATACPAGNTAVCMFAGARVGGVWQTYNGGPYVDNPSNTTIHRQISLTGAVGGQRHWRIERDAVQPRWNFVYGTGPNGSTWSDIVGWVPDSAWGGTFTSGGYTVLYTEVVSDQRVQSAQCTDAGTGVTPTTTAGHRSWNIDVVGTSAENMSLNDVVPAGLTGRASIKVSNTEARYGGGGGC